MERLQKIIAQSGLTSRRKAEQLILDGKVQVNGEIVTELGTKVSSNDIVLVNGQSITKEQKKYYILNKPSGVLSTVSDIHNRKTVMDFFVEESKRYRLFPVGRLDYDTTGLIILTNDGEFTSLITRPESHVEKEYLVRIKGILRRETSTKLEKGVRIDGYLTKPALINSVEYDTKNNSSLVSITISEGKYHQIKKMFEVVGHPVKKLRRIRIGSVTANELASGEYRELSIHEVRRLIGEAKQRKSIKRVRAPKQIRRY